MKNFAIICLLALVLPSTSFAYDVLTPTETEQALANNANFLLKAEHQKYCSDEPLRIEKEIAVISSQNLTQWSKNRRKEPLFSQMQENANKCEEIKQKIINQTLPTSTENKNFGCGYGLIKRGASCLTPTATCQMYFGQNVSGVKSITESDTAECTCNTGHSLTNGICIANNTSNVAAAVLGESTVSSEIQLKEIIARLTAQVATLVQQLNAKLGR